MATILYKTNESGDIEEIRVPAHRLQATLSVGWRLTRDEVLTEEPEVEEPEVNTPSASDSDTLTDDEVREMAREADIKYISNKSIDTLKDELASLLQSEG